MIKRPSRKLISSSLRSDLPLCVNTFDYNTSGSTTDPSVPLPSAVNITVNAPAKISYPSLGTSGFTASSNSYGVTSVYPKTPFTVSNPIRMQFMGEGKDYWCSTSSSSTSRNYHGSFVTGVRVTRSSNSSSTVFDTPASSFDGEALLLKLIQSGYYLRANFSYLFGVYGSLKTGTSTMNCLCFVYTPIKLLPQVFDLRALRFGLSNPTVDLYFWETQSGPASESVGVGTLLLGADEVQGTFTCSTSPSLIDTDNIVEEVFSTYSQAVPNSSTGKSSFRSEYGVVFGVTSLAFTL